VAPHGFTNNCGGAAIVIASQNGDSAREAIEAHRELLAEDGKAMPRPKPMSDWQADRRACTRARRDPQRLPDQGGARGDASSLTGSV
jgi:hypothetical protein